jgi:hypothetical protein
METMETVVVTKAAVMATAETVTVVMAGMTMKVAVAMVMIAVEDGNDGSKWQRW